ncbi:MAG: hypothetical protein EU532_14865 [Promethearchaeota archaeon]|nr:MAG: hypothetical protein EU532_14865 [Candidatus Lokiarchaeota archaeon]
MPLIIFYFICLCKDKQVTRVTGCSSKLEDDFESEFYNEILSQISKFSNNRQKVLHFICHKIIELMKMLNEDENKKFVQNALILIIALFEDCQPDFILEKGKDINEISNQEREILGEILRGELSF